MLTTLTDKRGNPAPTRTVTSSSGVAGSFSTTTQVRPQATPAVEEELGLANPAVLSPYNNISLQVSTLVREGALLKAGQTTRETILRLGMIIEILNKLQDFATLGRLLDCIKDMKESLGGKIIHPGKLVFTLLERAGAMVNSFQRQAGSNSNNSLTLGDALGLLFPNSKKSTR